jgi:hypothetical protein
VFGFDIEGLADALAAKGSPLTDEDFSFLVRAGRALSLRLLPSTKPSP